MSVQSRMISYGRRSDMAFSAERAFVIASMVRCELSLVRSLDKGQASAEMSNATLTEPEPQIPPCTFLWFVRCGVFAAPG